MGQSAARSSMPSKLHPPHTLEKQIPRGELVRRLFNLFRLLFFHLLPSLFFGILGLIFDDAARLFKKTAGFFRIEDRAPVRPSHVDSDVKSPALAQLRGRAVGATGAELKERTNPVCATNTSTPVEGLVASTQKEARMITDASPPNLLRGVQITSAGSQPVVQSLQSPIAEAGTDPDDESVEDGASEPEIGPPAAEDSESGNELGLSLPHVHYLPMANEATVESSTSLTLVSAPENSSRRLAPPPSPPPPPLRHISVAKLTLGRAAISTVSLAEPSLSSPQSPVENPILCNGHKASTAHLKSESLSASKSPSAGQLPVEQNCPQLETNNNDKEQSLLGNAIGTRGDTNEDYTADDCWENDATSEAAEAQLDAPLKLLVPDSSVMQSDHANGAVSELQVSHSRDELISRLQSNHPSNNDSGENDIAQDTQESGNEKHYKDKVNCEEERRYEDREAGDGLGRCSSKAVDVLDGNYVDADYGEVGLSSGEGSILQAGPTHAEAPTGVDCLQELIPEIIPEVTPKSAQNVKPPAITDGDPTLLPTMDDPSTDITLDEAAIISVASMEKIEKLPSLILDQHGSEFSFRSESYSSPDSPIQGSSSDPASHTRHRDSWRASDHDLFSEDPMIDLEGSGMKTSKRYNRPVSNSSFGPSLLEDYDSMRIMKRHAGKPDRGTFTDSYESEFNVSTPVTNSMDPESTHSRFDDLDSMQSWRLSGKSTRSREIGAENALFRQASMDVPSYSSPLISSLATSARDRQGLMDRTRSVMPRFTPSQLSSKVLVSKGRPVPTSRMGRSISSTEARFEDWPEYRPSRDGPTSMSRRHQSDMSFGGKSRKQALLSTELGEDEGPTVVGYTETEANVPPRFGGPRRGWKIGFGLGQSRETGEVRHVMRNILRRRRKASNLEESFTPSGAPSVGGSYHRGSIEKPSRRSISVDPDFTFEIELPQDTVFQLLNRICPECGYRVIVRKPHHKIKIEIPTDRDRRWTLVSISLMKVSHGRNTFASVARSKEDVSAGLERDIEAAGVLLQTRLGSHVEFIEDSFASLNMDNSSNELRRT